MNLQVTWLLARFMIRQMRGKHLNDFMFKIHTKNIPLINWLKNSKRSKIPHLDTQTNFKLNLVHYHTTWFENISCSLANQLCLAIRYEYLSKPQAPPWRYFELFACVAIITTSLLVYRLTKQLQMVHLQLFTNTKVYVN